MKNYFNDLKSIIKQSYAPYSKFYVAAIVETNKGNFTGINIENVSYSSTVCAERVAIFKAISSGAKEFYSLSLLASSRNFVVPCGACLQVMSEFFKPNVKLVLFNRYGKHRELMFKDILPEPFVKS